MDRGSTSSPSSLRIRAAATGLAVVFALFVWFVSVSSAAIDFAIAVVVAVGWCIWLERSASRGREMASLDQQSRRTHRLPAAMGLAIAVLLATPADAQTSPPDPNPGNLTLTGSFDVVSTYMFRGIRQHSTGIALWPPADLGVALYNGDGTLKSAAANVGTWNSLNTGDTGADGASGKLWYESDFYSTLTLGFGGGASVATTYTAYTSPNNAFTTVKELMFKAGIDDSPYLGKAALKPYAIFAFEFDTEPGVGQADGGAKAGRYLELGAAPGYSWPRASVSVPVKLGLSLSNYYELNTGTVEAPVYVDNRFGYFSVAGIATVPLGGITKYGAWNLHGGIEVQALGDTTKAFNGGDGSKVIGSIGIGFSY